MSTIKQKQQQGKKLYVDDYIIFLVPCYAKPSLESHHSFSVRKRNICGVNDFLRVYNNVFKNVSLIE